MPSRRAAASGALRSALMVWPPVRSMWARGRARAAPGGLVGIVAIGAAHDDPPPLPPIEPFAVRAVAHASTCAKVALRAQPVALVQRRALAALERQQLDVLGRMAGRAEGAGLLWVHRLDILVRIARCASSAMTTFRPRWHEVQGYWPRARARSAVCSVMEPNLRGCPAPARRSGRRRRTARRPARSSPGPAPPGPSSARRAPGAAVGRRRAALSEPGRVRRRRPVVPHRSPALSAAGKQPR